MISYFYGEDTYEARGAIAALAQKAGIPIRWLDKGDFERQSLRAWIDESRSGLFGSSLVVIRDPSSFSKALQESIAATTSDGSKLEAILWDRKVPDKRSKLFKAYKSSGREFSPPQFAELLRWLQEEAKKEEVVFDHGSAQALIAAIGSDRWRLASELEKLSLRTKTITVQHIVDEAIPTSSTEEIFPMLDALSQGNTAKAIQLIELFLQRGDSELYILSMLAYQFRTLFLIRRGMEMGRSGDALAREIGLHPYVVQKNTPAARRFSSEVLLSMLTRIAATDFAIKQGMVDQRTALIMIVASLAQQKTPH